MSQLQHPGNRLSAAPDSRPSILSTYLYPSYPILIQYIPPFRHSESSPFTLAGHSFRSEDCDIVNTETVPTTTRSCPSSLSHLNPYTIMEVDWSEKEEHTLTILPLPAYSRSRKLPSRLVVYDSYHDLIPHPPPTCPLPRRPEQHHDRQRQTGRPYGARPDRNPRPADRSQAAPTGSPALAARLGRPPTSTHARRAPAGTPPILKGDSAQRTKDKKTSQNRLAEMLRSEEMKQWIRSRVIEDGVLNMSVSQKYRVTGAGSSSFPQGLPNDPWLKKHEILPPGHRDAPETSGAIFWRLIDNVLQGVSLVFVPLLLVSQAHSLSPVNPKFIPFPLLKTTSTPSTNSLDCPAHCHIYAP